VNDYFTNVVVKALNAVPVVRPRLASWFGAPGPDPAEVSPEITSSSNFSEQHVNQSANRINAAPQLDAGPTTLPREAPPAEVAPAVLHAIGVRRVTTADDDNWGNSEAEAADAPLRIQTIPNAPDRRVTGRLPRRLPPTEAGAPTQGVTPELHKNISPEHATDDRNQYASNEVNSDDRGSASPASAVAGRKSFQALLAQPSVHPVVANRVTKQTAPIMQQENGGNAGVQRTEQELLSHARQLAPAGMARGMTAGAAAADTIHVSIGRIEVRATPAPQRPRNERQDRKSPNALEQYLERRSGGRNE